MKTGNSPSKKRPVVFLDRDGTLNIERGYIHNLQDLELIEGAIDAVKRLNENGIAAILVTNQSGAARGYYAESHILDLNKRLVDLLEAEGAYLDAVYYCPHLAEGTVDPYVLECTCRKPEIGMVERAYAENQDLDRQKSFVVGDKATDVELAVNCKAKGILVVTGYGQSVLDGTYQWKVQPDYVAKSITEAIDWVLQELSRTDNADTEAQSANK